MVEVTAPANVRPVTGMRGGSSRKLLLRKAVEKLGDSVVDGEALEASFPIHSDAAKANAADIEAPGPKRALPVDGCAPTPEIAVYGPPALTALAGTAVVSLAAGWSAEDESALQALLARRKAAGYQRRGRDVSAQLIKVGTIKPNRDTVVATIVGIVAERGNVSRSDLIDAMAVAAFPHAKAQPTDRGWCQGYVTGAIRNGFLELVSQPVTLTEPA